MVPRAFKNCALRFRHDASNTRRLDSHHATSLLSCGFAGRVCAIFLSETLSTLNRCHPVLLQTAARKINNLVDAVGVEPTTFSLQVSCSSQLSYPGKKLGRGWGHSDSNRGIQGSKPWVLDRFAIPH